VQSHGRPAREDHVAKGAKGEHLDQRRQGDKVQGQTQQGQRTGRPAAQPSQGSAKAHQAQPQTQDDSQHHLIAGKSGQTLAHERQLRHHARESQSGHGGEDCLALARPFG